ncbi:MAG: hypothetical protein V7L04_21165 [Nostoc sp.]|uniref:hypothetical protein n=1 Tax=Nostoc sp. TaxID=1180 RepID=UPI002FF81388
MQYYIVVLIILLEQCCGGLSCGTLRERLRTLEIWQAIAFFNEPQRHKEHRGRRGDAFSGLCLRTVEIFAGDRLS